MTYLNISQASREFGVSRTWIYQQIAKSDIDGYARGGRIVFKKEDLDRVLLPKKIEIAGQKMRRMSASNCSVGCGAEQG